MGYSIIPVNVKMKILDTNRVASKKIVQNINTEKSTQIVKMIVMKK